MATAVMTTPGGTQVIPVSGGMIGGINYRDINTRHQELAILKELTNGTNPTLTVLTDIEVIGFGALEAVHDLLTVPIKDYEGEWGPKYNPSSPIDEKTGLRCGEIRPPGLKNSMGIIGNISKRRPSVGGKGRTELITGIGKIQVHNYGSPQMLYPDQQAKGPTVLSRILSKFRGGDSN